MSELPNGWIPANIEDTLAPLDNGAVIHQGWSPRCESEPSTSPEQWGVLKTTAIQDGAFLSHHNKALPSSLSPKPEREVAAGDVLLTCAGPRVRCGITCLIRKTRPKLILSGKMYRFRPYSELLDPRFLEAFLRTPEIKLAIDAMKTGISESGMNITREKFAALIVPIPPLPEQKRIADRLDSTLARVEACRDRLDRLPALLKRFRQSILAAATSGRLTEDWRAKQTSPDFSESYPSSEPPAEAPSIPESWRWTAVGNLASKVTDGVHKKPNYVAEGIPFLTVRNLTAGSGIDFSETSFITASDHEEFCRRTHPERDDLLISKDGTLGVIRRVDTDRPFSIFVSLALVKPKNRRMSKYLLYAMQAPVLQKQMVGVGTGLLHIHLRDLRQDVVPLPPLSEQHEIVRRVETLFAFADRLEARLATARKQVDQLTPALLAKAFRGELVPQDPNDEPASELLKRLAAQREAAPKTRRGRKAAAL